MAQPEKGKGGHRRRGFFLILVILFPPYLQDLLHSGEPLPGDDQKVLCAAAPPPQQKKTTVTEKEAKLLCAFKLFRYTEWPEEKIDGNKKEGREPFKIGVVGKDSFGRYWNIIEGKPVRGRPVRIVKFGDFKTLPQKKPAEGGDKNASPLTREDLKKCQALFICNSEAENVTTILRLVDRHGVLTIGEKRESLEKGVILRVFIKNLRVAFDVNLDAARKGGLTIRSSAVKQASRRINSKKGK